ncbi:MAG: hypothetical protein IKV17_07770 [Bacteroidaceae bacterium]|nr:hypothetical protein [Bacteroidaceae bacterium]
MSMYSNGQILSAVISHWSQPLVGQIVQGKVASIPVLGMAENWIKNLGIVSPNYSIMKDLAPVIGGVSDMLISPFLNRYLAMVDDSSLPAMAHGIVDRAIENGELSLADGFLVIEESDLKRLKRLLELNLPLAEEDFYIVKTE